MIAAWSHIARKASPYISFPTKSVRNVRFIQRDGLFSSAGTVSRRFSNAKPFDEIPGPSALKNIWTIATGGGLKNLPALQEKKFAEYGPIFKDKLLGKQVVNLSDADAIETVYRAESKFPLRPPFEVITESWREFGGILGNDYECWTKVRSYSSKQMLRPVEVKKHCDEFNEISADLVRRFRKIRQPKGQVQNLELEAMGWSGEAMGQFVYGQRLGFYQEPQNARVFDFINASTTFGESVVQAASGPPIWKYVKTPAYKRILQSISVLEGIGDEFIEIIKAKRRGMVKEESATTSHALFDHFIATGGLTAREMNTIALGLTQAAFEGTSFTVQWLMYHLSCNPEIQDRAYEEILSIHGPSRDDAFSYDSLKAMSFTKACIKEAQRLSPTALFLSRLTEKDLVLCGYTVPAGTELFLYPSLLSRSSNFYDKAWSFAPDRWAKKNPNPYVYLPFGHGVRMCLGRRVAELELLVLAAHLTRAFRMKYIGTKVPQLEFRVGVHKPSLPLEILFDDRRK